MGDWTGVAEPWPPLSPINAGLPGARSALTVQRDWSEKIDPLPKQNSHTRHFLTSLSVQEKTRATRAVRGHWSVENRNHHKRDASADPHHALRLILKASPAL